MRLRSKSVSLTLFVLPLLMMAGSQANAHGRYYPPVHHHHHGGAGCLDLLLSTTICEGISTTAEGAARKAELQNLQNVAVQYLNGSEESPLLEDAVSSYERVVLKIDDADQEDELTEARVTRFVEGINELIK